MSSSPNTSLKDQCLALKPWRKGPFTLDGITIDAEWRCDLKWQRLLPGLPDLKNKTILDIGCNNGYFMFRMLEHNPKSVLGIDPTEHFENQFRLVHRFHPSDKLRFERRGWQEIQSDESFDVTFCMGILYHHRDPMEILRRLRGSIVLETLILDQAGSEILIPKKHYAGMRNVYAIPTIHALTDWIKAAGLTHIDVISVAKTTPVEQRVTEWSGPVSLAHFLDPTDPAKTIEGYPAPVRAIIRCDRI